MYVLTVRTVCVTTKVTASVEATGKLVDFSVKLTYQESMHGSFSNLSSFDFDNNYICLVCPKSLFLLRFGDFTKIIVYVYYFFSQLKLFKIPSNTFFSYDVFLNLLLKRYHNSKIFYLIENSVLKKVSMMHIYESSLYQTKYMCACTSFFSYIFLIKIIRRKIIMLHCVSNLDQFIKHF